MEERGSSSGTLGGDTRPYIVRSSIRNRAQLGSVPQARALVVLAAKHITLRVAHIILGTQQNRNATLSDACSWAGFYNTHDYLCHCNRAAGSTGRRQRLL